MFWVVRKIRIIGHGAKGMELGAEGMDWGVVVFTLICNDR